jgi:hypothetical protein
VRLGSAVRQAAVGWSSLIGSFSLPFSFSLKCVAQYQVRVGPMSLNLWATSGHCEHLFLRRLNLSRLVLMALMELLLKLLSTSSA